MMIREGIYENIKGGSVVAICILIFNGEWFHGQYREIYRGAVCDDILHNETDVCAGHTVWPTHGGASALPYTFFTAEGRDGPIGRRRETPYNLAIILVFISVRPLLSPT